MAFLARSWRLFAVSWRRAAILRSYSATAGNKDEIMMKEEKQNVVEVVSPDELVSLLLSDQQNNNILHLINIPSLIHFI